MSYAAKIKTRIIILHIAGCLMFLCMPLLSDDPRHGSHQISEVLENAFTIVFFYLNYYYLIDQFFFKRRYLAFVACALTGFIIVSTLPELLTDGWHLQSPPSGTGREWPPPPGSAFFTHPAWRLFGPLDENLLKYSVVSILAITLRMSGRLRKVQKEKGDAEIMFLKAQINPHFLFNTLNSIYTLAVEAGAGSAAGAIVQLSGMMRYATSEAGADRVTLAQELKYIDNYVVLQKLRLNEGVTLRYEISGATEGREIAPFLIIPFIENAFKYGVSTDEPCSILILIHIAGSDLVLQVRNRKVHTVHDKGTGTAIGLDNTRRRLQLLYPGRHQLAITDKDGFFEVNMSIRL